MLCKIFGRGTLNLRDRGNSRRIAAAMAVLVLHAAIITVLLAGRQISRTTNGNPDVHNLTWIVLPFISEPRKVFYYNLSIVPAFQPTGAPVQKAFELLVRPQAEIKASSAVPDEAIFGSVGQALDCNLMNFETLSGQEKQHCINRLGGLRNAPASVYVLTRQEQQVQKELVHALAVKKAPPLVPCVTAKGVMITPAVIRCLFNGFDSDKAGVPTYADSP